MNKQQLVEKLSKEICLINYHFRCKELCTNIGNCQELKEEVLKMVDKYNLCSLCSDSSDDLVIDLDANVINASEPFVAIPKETYKYLKQIEKSFNPFEFCSIDGCEGCSPTCRETCADSIFVKRDKKTIEKILKELYIMFSADYLLGMRNEYKNFTYAEFIKRYAKQYAVEVSNDD